MVLLIAALAAGCNDAGQTPVASHEPDNPIPPAVRRQLGALGYLGGIEPAPELDGVLVHDPARAYEGVNLYVAGHSTEAILMDMEGNVLHTWVGPDMQPESAKERFWVRTHLFPSGDILVIHDGVTMLKLDKESNVLWEYSHHPHHDMDILPDGRIYVIARESRIVPSINSTALLAEDHVVLLDPDGRELKRVSIPLAFEKGGHPYVMKALAKLAEEQRFGDITHTNSIQILDGRFADQLPEFKKGNLLLSSPKLSTIFVLDFEAEEVVWKVSNRTAGRRFRLQHHPTMLASGNILFFDNRGPAVSDGSVVYEFDPVSLQEGWTYGGSPEHKFYSRNNGTCYRLPNGNTLIVESQSGRAFEVTADKDIVWDFVVPQRKHDDEGTIAQLFDLMRLRPDSVDWLRD
jgi:hypothetical protein